MSAQYDVIIVGASFAGLTLAHHLPKHLRVLVIDRKTALNSAIESTGLITEATRALLAGFVNVDAYIPNAITTIGVVSPTYREYFFSHTEKPWIYSTDTPELVAHMAKTVPEHVHVELGAGLLSYEVHEENEYPVSLTYLKGGVKYDVNTRFLVGADGSHSTVAKGNPRLSTNKRFLLGHEKVFYGDITLGEHPEHTIYHFWFGEFSLGYGGWLSPTIVNGRKAFRLGIAKLEKDKKDIKKIDEFIRILKEKQIIRIDTDTPNALLAFGHLIPIGGVLPRIYDSRTLLIGDAAGFCGAFAADGIKGAIVSGKVAAECIPKFLEGDTSVFHTFFRRVDAYNNLMMYYWKQRLYRFLWDRMSSNRSFQALYTLIERQKENFLYQFCDSKDKQKSLIRMVVSVRNIPRLFLYGMSVLADMVLTLLSRFLTKEEK